MIDKRMLLYLNGETASWTLSDKIEQGVFWGALSDAALVAVGYCIDVVVSGEDVLLTSVALPSLPKRRALQAVPFALEEQLIDDIQQLHFSVGDYIPSQGMYPVAVVSLAKMNDWMGLLQSVGIQSAALIPDTLLLPFLEDHWTVACLDNRCIVRTGLHQGFACESDHLNEWLILQLEEIDSVPKVMDVYVFETERVALSLKDVSINVVDANKNDFLMDFGRNSDRAQWINMLQGLYQRKQKMTVSRRYWKAACAVVALCVLCSFLSSVALLVMFNHALSGVHEKIVAIYRNQFPAATTLVAPRERMEEKLKRLGGADHPNHFLMLLSAALNSAPPQTGVRWQAMQYEDNQLMLTVLADNAQCVAQWVDAMRMNHLFVQQEKNDISGAGVSVHLIIKGAT